VPRTLLTAAVFVCSVLAIGLTACEREQDHPSLPPATAPSTQSSAAELAASRQMLSGTAQPAALPANHPPLSDMQPPAGMMGMGDPHAGMAGVLKYTAPTVWKEEPPKTAMRAGQFRLPHVGNDTEDGELAIFNPSIGGGVEANLMRWRGQFSTPDGQPIPDAGVVRASFEANGLKVTIIDVAGRYTGMAMMGAPTAPKDNYRMLGAIVETPDGPWYFKATGPGDTMGAQREAFVQFMHTVKYEAAPGTPAEPNTPGKG